MGTEAKGEVRKSSTGAYSAVVRTWVKRETIQMPTCHEYEEAEARSALLAAVAKKFRLASVNRAQGDEALRILAAASPKALRAAITVCEELLGGKIPAKGAPNQKTFKEVGQWWTSGGARKDYPRQVKPITSEHASGCAQRLERAIYPLIGSRPIGELTRGDCDAVLRQLPANPKGGDLSDSTIRQYALLMTRIFGLAELAGHVDRSPLPRGWAGAPSPEKRFPILYPTEDRALLGATKIPLWARLYFGFLHREGCRRGEGVAMQCADVDLVHGTLSLDENKTDHPRFWKLAPGVSESLAAWFALRGGVKPDERVFVDESNGPIDVDHMADKLRAWMQKAAGLDRADLYSVGPNKGRFGTHCFRRSMVTRNLALGVNEDVVRRRTGHKSDQLLRYRQGATALAELDLGDVDPLVLCIPELSPIPGIEALLRKLSKARTEPAWPLPTLDECHTGATQMVGAAGFEPTTLRPPV